MIASTNTVIETVVAIGLVAGGGVVALGRWERGQRDVVLDAGRTRCEACDQPDLEDGGRGCPVCGSGVHARASPASAAATAGRPPDERGGA